MQATAPERPKARVMMVDDHPIMREGMALFMNSQPDLDLCAQASSADEALALLPEARPDLIIVDISLGRDSGIDLIKTLRRRSSCVRLLAMSLHDESIFAERALHAGANGYLMKQEATRNILLAARTVLAGETYLSPAMKSRLQLSASASKADEAPSVAGITEREFEVLHLIGLGFGTREISEKLNRSAKTIETHRANLRDKLKLGNTSSDLVRFATRWVDEHARNA